MAADLFLVNADVRKTLNTFNRLVPLRTWACLQKGRLPRDPQLAEGKVSGKPSSTLFSAKKPSDYTLGLPSACVPWPSWQDGRSGVCSLPRFTQLAFSEQEERAGGGPLGSRSLWYGLPRRLFVQVVPDYHYQTSHYKNPRFLRFELKEWWHDRLTFSYFTPLHAPMLFSTTSV